MDIANTLVILTCFIVLPICGFVIGMFYEKIQTLNRNYEQVMNKSKENVDKSPTQKPQLLEATPQPGIPDPMKKAPQSRVMHYKKPAEIRKALDLSVLDQHLEAVVNKDSKGVFPV